MSESTDSIVLRDATGVDVELPVAGMGSRGFAFIIDWHIRIALVAVWMLFILGLETMGLVSSLSGLFATSPYIGGILVFGPLVVFYFLYHPLMEIFWGTTPGKYWAGVSVVDDNGRPATGGAHLLRNIFRLVDSLPFAYILGVTVALFHPLQLRLGDLAAGTALVLTPREQKRGLEEAKAAVQSGRLTTEQYELALDLLSRWRSMSRDRRISLGCRFLEQVGDGRPSADSRQQLEAEVHRRIKALTGNGHGQ